MRILFFTLSILYLLFQTTAFSLDALTLHTGDFPPYSKVNMKDKGYSSAIVTEAFKAAGRNVNILFYPWPRALNVTKKTNNTASYPWAMNKKRQQDFFYSNVIHEDKIKMFGKKDTKIVKSRVCVPHDWDTSQIGYLLSKYEMVITEGPNETYQCFQMIKHGRVDFIFLNERTALYELKILGLDKEIIAHNKISTDDFTYLIAGKNNPKSQDIINDFNKGLAIIKKNGRFQETTIDFFKK